MKSIILIAAVLSFGYLNAQSESKVEKKYERYENGELIEDQYYLEKDGKAIKGNDFEMPSFEDFSLKMDSKMAEMTARMDQMRMEMDQRMAEMKKRTSNMRLETQRKMSENKVQKETNPRMKSNSNIKTTYS